MSSKVIFMDGIATAHLRADGSVRIELANTHSNAMESSLARIPAAIRRARPSEMRPPEPQAYSAGEPGAGPSIGAAVHTERTL